MRPALSSRPFLSRRLLALGAIGVMLLLVLGIAVFRTGERSHPNHQSAEAVATPSTAPVESFRSLTEQQEDHATRTEPEERQGVDGSNSYKEAFRIYGQLTDQEKALISKSKREIDAAQAAALFEKLQPLMAFLHAGAQADYCDWALGPMSVDSGLPFLSKAQELAKAARWVAAYRFPTDPESAINDLAARARLGHDVSEMLIGLLVNSSFESSAVELLRENVEYFTPEAFSSARALLAGSTLPADLTRAFTTEVEGLERLGERLAAMTPEERLAYLKQSTPAIDPSLANKFRDPAAIREEFAFAAKIDRALAAALPLREADYQAAKQQIEKEIADRDSTIAQSLPVFDMLRTRLQQVSIQREMLRAGLDLLQGGPSLSGEARDPHNGQPFLCVWEDDGFTLQSSFQVKGKPLVMSFPYP